MENANWLSNNMFLGIMGRHEAESVLSRFPEDVLKNTLLISIINPNTLEEQIDNIEKMLKEVKEGQIEISRNGLNGKVDTKKMNIKEAKTYLEKLKRLRQEKRKSLATEDINSFPIDEDLRNRVFDSITVSFWDVEEPIGPYRPLSEEDALKIAEFIKKHKDKIGKDLKVLIHCSAGISRSAGTAMAVKCIVEHDGDKYDFSMFPCAVTGHRRYSPNLTVFDKIVEAFNKIKD